MTTAKAQPRKRQSDEHPLGDVHRWLFAPPPPVNAEVLFKTLCALVLANPAETGDEDIKVRLDAPDFCSAIKKEYGLSDEGLSAVVRRAFALSNFLARHVDTRSWFIPTGQIDHDILCAAAIAPVSCVLEGELMACSFADRVFLPEIRRQKSGWPA